MAETGNKTVPHLAPKGREEESNSGDSTTPTEKAGEKDVAGQAAPQAGPRAQGGGNAPANLAQRRAAAARQQAARQKAASRQGARLHAAPASAPGTAPADTPDAKPDSPAQPAQGPAPRAVAKVARPQARHWGLLASFLALVCLPAIGASIYLWGVAVNQYSSTIGFAVRSEQTQSSLDVLGGLSMLTGGSSSSSDMDILYKYLQSQDLVAAVDKQVDLRAKWSPPYKHDPYFGLDPDSTIEDLTDYWQRMVILSYDTSTGLMEITVKAFTPEDARQIAHAIFDQSSKLVNRLSETAREDGTRYARQELDQAKDTLKGASQALTAFRMKTRMVDPTADIQGQMGLLTSLQSQLAQALINLDLLRETAKPNDPRIVQAQRTIDVIRKRMDDERNRFSADGTSPSGENYAKLVANYEHLDNELTFAQKTYAAALGAYDAAVSQAQQQSRYLATYIKPTLAQQSLYPERSILLLTLIAFLLLGWSVAALIYYSIRDRR